MIRRGIGLGGRLAAVALAMTLVFSLAGDRGRAATMPAVINGQDPLEVLSLKIRPNVIIVLDSSGSMTRQADESDDQRAGDHPRSKMYQAKQVLKQVITANQDKVSFQLGTYTQYGIYMSYQDAGDNRFQYVASQTDFPSMTTTELTVGRATGDSGERGLQSWQIIYPEWNTLWFDTGGATCTATLAAPSFYASGSALATALQAAMRATACGDDFTVTYDIFIGRFYFSRTSFGPLDIHWSNGGANNIAEALGGRGTNDQESEGPYTLLYRTTGTGDSNVDLDTRWTIWEEIPPRSGNWVPSWQLRSGRLWNGEVVRVEADGDICGMDFATPATKTNPPSVTLQLVQDGCGGDVAGNRVRFDFGGGRFTGNNRSCNGFRSKSDLIPCDLQSPPAPTQISLLDPYLDTELPFDVNGDAADWDNDGQVDYVERMDGSWGVETINVSPAAKASGATPIANSLIDIKGLANGGDNSCIVNPAPVYPNLDRNDVTGTTGACQERGFAKLWNTGQTGSMAMAGPPPWQLDPISTHTDPKEKTIVLFVTDGDDTCSDRPTTTSASGSGDPRARRAAFWAEELYRRIDPAESASSVQTYVIGFGGAWAAAGPYRLNWIAWGGSGLGQNLPGQPDVNWTSDSDTDLANARAQCSTCEDAFIAPDAATLAAQLQAIIDQGASDGEFSAQQSITESVFEYVDIVPSIRDAGGQDMVFHPDDPVTRYEAIVPTRFVSSFTLPGFRGRLRAIQARTATPPNPDPCDGSGNCLWDAGEKLRSLVANGMADAGPNGCDTTADGGAPGHCSFDQLHGGGSLAAASIQRRIFTTTRNGVYTYSPSQLIAHGGGTWTPPERLDLWPPDPSVIPTNYSGMGLLDEELGLPLDSPSCTLDVTLYSSCAEQEYARLQNEFGACVGGNRPAGCSDADPLVQMKAARREAREMILAFMAGATPYIDGNGGPERATSGSDPGTIFYVARSWVLADSEMATPAVVTPPLAQGDPKLSEPVATPWVQEYLLFRDGAGTMPRPNSDAALRAGFGLWRPETKPDPLPPTSPVISVPDGRANLKPVMTVVYVPANDMLHAFRAGPNVAPSGSCAEPAIRPAWPTAADECGGQELWGFVPYDQLNALPLRFINEPQGRDNHVFMLARAVRFSDVFVPSSSPVTVTINGESHTIAGVWRRILYVLRGIGGKYVTAIDITAPGPYTGDALSTQPPIPLWSRGNPDTQDGTASGAHNNTIDSTDKAAYDKMGETWSVPALVYLDKTGSSLYQTARRPAGVDYVLFTGSGYGAAGEGTTFYALDALSGDIIAATDVEVEAATRGLTRTSLTYDNALVANAVGFNEGQFHTDVIVHPAATKATRMYIGDIHGRLWKFLTAAPDVAIPFADVGEDQPIGTAVSLLGMPPPTTNPPLVPVVPYVYAVSGNDNRADGPFNMYGFRDNGTDTQISVGAGVVTNGITTFPPAEWLHDREYDQGAPIADCGYTEEGVFRGTVQPATSFAEVPGSTDTLGRVFYAGTRLNLPNTKFAPPTPLACSAGDYPCRSSFDSTIYVLGAKSGQAAYDLNASGDDAYRIFRDSRLAAIAMLADPTGTGQSTFAKDEGMMQDTPDPPPVPGPTPGKMPNVSVIMVRQAGQPPPSVSYGSTVCR